MRIVSVTVQCINKSCEIDASHDSYLFKGVVGLEVAVSAARHHDSFKKGAGINDQMYLLIS